MARKKAEENGVAVQEMPPAAAPPSDTNGEAEEKKRPCRKFGPYAVDKGNNVQVAVWDRQITLQDGREITVYSATVQASYLDQQSGQWVNTAFFRGAALPIVCHALMKAFDWILEARNEARSQPKEGVGPIPF